MRNYKFRGKSLSSGEWIYGDLDNAPMGTFISFNEYSKDKKTQITTISRKTEMVDSETVGQFTGLLDRNGKEIYEGDILKGITNKWRLESRPDPHSFVGYVSWGDQCDIGLKWELTTIDSSGSNPLNEYVDCVAVDYSTGEIIGNIHDNHELLKECPNGTC